MSSVKGLSPAEINHSVDLLITGDPRIRALSKVAAWPYVLAASRDWLVIFGAAFLASYTSSFAAYVVACMVIGGRQHGFFALSHEAAHSRISLNRKWNDFLSNCLFAFPILFDTDAYRRNHLQHHSHLNSEKDPDWMRKKGLPQWSFRISFSYVAAAFPKFLLWNGPKEWVLIMLQLARVLPIRTSTTSESLKYIAKRAAYYGAWAIPITYFHLWGAFMAYWLVPLFFVFPTLQRIRSVAEHFGIEHTHVLEQTRNIAAPWYERMLLAPYNLHYHIDHHLVAGVPFYHLPQLHAVLKECPVFREFAHENTSYVVPSRYPLAHDLFTRYSRRGSESPRHTKLAKAA